MIPRRCYATALVSLACLSAAAQDFKGIKLGATQEEARQAVVSFASSWTCVPESDKEAAPRILCLVEGFTYAGVDARDATLFFEDGKLTQVFVTVPPRTFGGVVDALAAKHGKPARTSHSSVRNGLGATFDQVEHEWRPSKGNIIVAQRFGSSLDASLIVIANQRALIARGNAASKKARGDI